MKRNKFYMIIAFLLGLFFFSVPPRQFIPAHPLLIMVDTPAFKESTTDSLTRVYTLTLKEAETDYKEAEKALQTTNKVIKETGTILSYYSKLRPRECIVYVKDTVKVVGVRNRTWMEKLRTLNFKKTEDITKDTIIKINK